MKTCNVEECGRTHYGLGFCRMHYRRYKKHGDVSIVKQPTRGTHGMKHTPEYTAWCNMKARCYKKSHRSFKDYGGRGIQVCGRWLNSFENFYADMGDKPSDKHSVDRINNNGNYYPDNCRWATQAEQSDNGFNRMP